jgi:disulfide bond formation protein DsbB
MDNIMTTRSFYLLGLIIICSVLSTSLYFQYVDGILPCPLCTLQRITFVLLGSVFLAGLLLPNKRRGRFITNTLATFIALIGIGLAGRQVWLQHFPSANSNECGVSLQYMMQVLPLQEVVQKIFQGTAECTQRGWEFLSLNMAEWALICFSGFFLLSIYLLIKRKQ